jgi:hypothetical protein
LLRPSNNTTVLMVPGGWRATWHQRGQCAGGLGGGGCPSSGGGAGCRETIPFTPYEAFYIRVCCLMERERISDLVIIDNILSISSFKTETILKLWYLILRSSEGHV